MSNNKKVTSVQLDGFTVSAVITGRNVNVIRSKVNKLAYFLRKLECLIKFAEDEESLREYETMQKICFEAMSRTRIIGSGGTYADNLYFFKINEVDILEESDGDYDKDDLERIYSIIMNARLGLTVSKEDTSFVNDFLDFVYFSELIPRSNDREAIAINWKDNIWEVLTNYDGRIYRKYREYEGLSKGDESLYVKLALKGLI